MRKNSKSASIMTSAAATDTISVGANHTIATTAGISATAVNTRAKVTNSPWMVESTSDGDLAQSGRNHVRRTPGASPARQGRHSAVPAFGIPAALRAATRDQNQARAFLSHTAPRMRSAKAENCLPASRHWFESIGQDRAARPYRDG